MGWRGLARLLYFVALSSQDWRFSQSIISESVLRCCHTRYVMKTTLIFPGQRLTSQRGLACLLLLLITYGVTFEVAQSHSLVGRNSLHVAALGNTVAPQSSDKRSSHSKECPLCQFQAQLFSSLVHAPVLLCTPSIRVAFVSTQTHVHLSTTTIPTSDRAPPLGLA